MDTRTIATNIRSYRLSRHWSQEELARSAGVDARTVQRAESGRSPIAVDTLKAFAAVFDVGVEDFQISEEALRVVLEEFHRRYKLLEMSTLDRSSNVGDYFASTHSSCFYRLGELTEEQLDEVALLHENVADYIDIWSDIPASGHRDAEKEVFSLVQTLSENGVAVTWALEKVILGGTEHAEATLFTILHVAAAPKAAPASTLVLEKRRSLSFV